jgi:hypothetical protein
MSLIQQPKRPRPSRRSLRNSRWRGARLLPYMDDFLIFADNKDANSTAPRPRRVPTRSPWARTQPKEGPMGAYTSLLARRRPRERHYNRYLQSPSFETTRHCYPLPDPTATLCTRRPLATYPTSRSTRRKSTLPLPRHPGGSFLQSRTARRPRYTNMMGRTGKTPLSIETRLRVVDASPLSQQRPLHLLPNRDRLHALRQLNLRLGAILNEQEEARGLWSVAYQQQHITWK